METILFLETLIFLYIFMDYLQDYKKVAFCALTITVLPSSIRPHSGKDPPPLMNGLRGGEVGQRKAFTYFPFFRPFIEQPARASVEILLQTAATQSKSNSWEKENTSSMTFLPLVAGRHPNFDSQRQTFANKFESSPSAD